MEENREEIQEPRYQPRPKWQLALAWVALPLCWSAWPFTTCTLRKAASDADSGN